MSSHPIPTIKGLLWLKLSQKPIVSFDNGLIYGSISLSLSLFPTILENKTFFYIKKEKKSRSGTTSRGHGDLIWFSSINSLFYKKTAFVLKMHSSGWDVWYIKISSVYVHKRITQPFNNEYILRIDFFFVLALNKEKKIPFN